MVKGRPGLQARGGALSSEVSAVDEKDRTIAQLRREVELLTQLLKDEQQKVRNVTHQLALALEAAVRS